jgi:serine phosphatase RsbU (regulator of sigma subunit)
VGGIAIWGTTHGFGPWVTGSLDVRLIQLDSWMSVFAFTGLVLGAVTAEKRQARFELSALLDRTKHSVETLQAAFLPAALPQPRGLHTDAVYIPAEREALIGGDWYDAFALPDGRIVFSIGDVAGHGLDAAVAGASLRRSVFAASFEVREPAEILARVNATLHLSVDPPATAIVAIVSADLSEMRYASAGHPPPILAGPTTPAHLLEHGGIPFGVGAPIAAITHSVTLEEGAVVLFYTDGLTEFQRDIVRAEAAMLRAVTLLVADPGIERPAAWIQRRVMGSQRPVDDTVLLVVRR